MTRVPLFAALLLLTACQPARIQQDVAEDPCVIANGAGRGAPLRAHGVRIQPAVSLVHVDCTGAVRPDLAVTWSDSAGASWTFGLRPDARDAHGNPLTSHDVLAAWSTSRLVSSFVTSLSARGDRELHVTLRHPAAIDIFADSAFAVRAADAPLTLLGGIARNAVDDDADLVVTSDAAVIDYARARGDYAATPLPWTRTYVVLTFGDRRQHRVPDEVAASLARDAVRAPVRAAVAPFWWEATPCFSAGSAFLSHPDARDVVYPRGDAIAQALAERVVAQAWPAQSTPEWLRALLPPRWGAAGAPRAAGLDEAVLLQAIRTRVPLAVVLPAPRTQSTSCHHPDSALRAALAAGWQITPLIDARDVLLHRQGVGRITVDASGALRLGQR